MTQERRGKPLPLVTQAAIASVCVACLLLSLKGFAAWRTESVAMLSSLADTGLDFLASSVTLFSVRVAARPPDHDHRFGHGKAEALAALFQVALVTLSAAAIAWRAASTLGGSPGTQDAEVGVGVSLLAIGVTVALLLYQRSVVRKTGSVAILADSVHYQSDVLLSVAVILALVLDQWIGWRGADAIFGIFIAAYLAWGALRASSQSIGLLMDREWPVGQRTAFLDVASRQPGLRGLHDFRTRSSGAHDFAQFHMEVDGEMNVAAAHDIVEATEVALRAAFPKVDVLIHLDPEGHLDTQDEMLEADVTPHWFAKRI